MTLEEIRQKAKEEKRKHKKSKVRAIVKKNKRKTMKATLEGLLKPGEGSTFFINTYNFQLFEINRRFF